MKPCLRNRKRLAWLVLDELDAREAAQLRLHMETCAGCRRYFEEVSAVKATLASADGGPEVVASESFHRRLASRLRAEPAGSPWGDLAGRLAGLRLTWRVALPALGAAAVLIVLVSSLARHPGAPVPAPIRLQAEAIPNAKSDPAPTIANYERVANRSLDELDDLLTRQAIKSHSPAPIYRASLFAFANASD